MLLATTFDFERDHLREAGLCSYVGPSSIPLSRHCRAKTQAWVNVQQGYSAIPARGRVSILTYRNLLDYLPSLPELGVRNDPGDGHMAT
jgi:hypothetical protein